MEYEVYARRGDDERALLISRNGHAILVEYLREAGEVFIKMLSPEEIDLAGLDSMGTVEADPSDPKSLALSTGRLLGWF